MPDDTYNAVVAASSGCKEVHATIGGVCSAVAVDDSGGILRLFLLPPLHL